jgi:Glycosyltransferase sugar-binding region containing DXD motif
LGKGHLKLLYLLMQIDPDDKEALIKAGCFIDPEAVVNQTVAFSAMEIATDIEDTCLNISRHSQCGPLGHVWRLLLLFQVPIIQIDTWQAKAVRVLHPWPRLSCGNEHFDWAVKEFNIKLLPYRNITHVYDRPVNVIEHVSDIARMEALVRFGGLYFDMDAFVLNPMIDSMKKYESMMGQCVLFIVIFCYIKRFKT